MKLKSDFILHRSDRETFLVPVGGEENFNGMVQLNDTAAFLVDTLREACSYETLLAALAAEYDGTPAQHAQAIETTLSTLRSIGALEE